MITKCIINSIVFYFKMPNEKLGHDENRKKVCAPCGKKIVLGTKKKDYFVLNLKFILLIKFCERKLFKFR